jgi:hypothetical protein
MMSRPRGRLGNLDGDCVVSIEFFLSIMEPLTLDGRKSLCILCGPMGILLRGDCCIVSLYALLDNCW